MEVRFLIFSLIIAKILNMIRFHYYFLRLSTWQFIISVLNNIKVFFSTLRTSFNYIFAFKILQFFRSFCCSFETEERKKEKAELNLCQFQLLPIIYCDNRCDSYLVNVIKNYNRRWRRNNNNKETTCTTTTKILSMT